jgi:hypothetical protein
VKRLTPVIITCLAAAVIVLALELVRMSHADTPPKLNTTFQAVLLDNGQVFYGKLSGLDTPYPKMTDVYYILSSQDPQTKQVKNVLVKRGKELHGPTETFFDRRHIVMIEPVSPTSEVARRIAQAESQSK